MLLKYLQKAIKELSTLKELTLIDITDIKLAKHEAIFARIEQKEIALKAFEEYKSLIDSEIKKIVDRNPGVELSSLLDDDIKSKLTFLRESLEELQEINREFARFVITVGEFYNSLYEQVLPIEKDGYTKKTAKLASILELRV